MTKYHPLHRFALYAATTISVCLTAGLGIAAEFSPLPPGVPDLSSGNFGFAADSFDFYPPTDGSPGPVKNDPAHPFCRNGQNCVVTPRIGEPHSPILQPWSQAVVDKWNDDILNKGKQAFAAQSRCWPGGVPNMMTYTAEPQYFLQTPNEVTIVYQRGPNVRHVYLNVPHSKNPAPTWLGESVGHYEGNTLVVDTIGLNDKTFVDNFRTPHTTQLHVVERYTIAADRKSITATVKVEDPGAFTTQWSAEQHYKLHHEPISESENVCAENNDANYFGEDEVPIPQTATPDF
jgi:hypothetical protein